MNTGAGFLLIVVGLLLLYSVITGKLAIIENAFNQLFNIAPPQPSAPVGSKSTGTTVGLPSIGSGVITLPDIFVPDYTKQP